MLEHNNRRRTETNNYQQSSRDREARMNEALRQRLGREQATRTVAERMHQVHEELERLSPEAEEMRNRILESNNRATNPTPSRNSNGPNSQWQNRPGNYRSHNEAYGDYQAGPSSREPKLFSNYFYTGIPILSSTEEENTRIVKGVVIMSLSDNTEYYVPTRMRVSFHPQLSQQQIDEEFQEKQSEWIERRLHQDIPKALNENKMTFTNIKGTFSKTLEGVKMRVINTASIQSVDILLEEEFSRLYNPRGQLAETFFKISNPLE